jgi:flagellin
MSVINTNVNSLIAQNAVNVNARALSSAMEQLSTGKRINGSKDDAAGLSISQIMTAQIRGLNQAVRNANDGVSLLQTADGAMIEQTNMMQRMRELAVQSASDTVTPDQKVYLDKEYQALLTEIDRIGAATQWNGKNLLDATGGTAGAGTYVFQVGANASQSISVVLGKARTDGILSTLALTKIVNDSTGAAATTSTTEATAAITAIDAALKASNNQRAAIGAGINQLTYAADNLTNISMNTAASRSRIEDTDYATASTELARTQIIQQAATAMLAQANQSPQSVLALLK